MISEEAAFASAREFLDGHRETYTPVLLPKESLEHAVAWLVRFDSKEHLETGDMRFMPFTRVLVVPKGGTPVHFPPTYLPLEVYLDELAAGEWPVGPGGRYKRDSGRD